MKKYVIFLIAIFLFFGCKTTKETIQSEKEVHTSTKEEKRFESLYFGIIDSLQKIKAPIENSKTIGLQYSFLNTSLAWSIAKIDSLGVLSHEISNNDSIEQKVVYKWNFSEEIDTIIIWDSLYLDKSVITKEKLNKFSTFFLYSGYIFWVILILGLLYFVFRLIKR